MSPTHGQAAGERFDPTTQEELPSTAVTRLHLLRHGEVESFGERVVRGQLDAPLTERGRGQHRVLAEWLVDCEAAPQRIYTSDLSRCEHLARELETRTGLTAERDPRLREQSMGAWQGRTWGAITREDAARIHAYWNDYVNVRPPGGESLRELSGRVADWWEALRPELEDRRVAVVTHVGVIRALLCHLLDVPAEHALRFAPAVASHTAVLVSDAGAVLAALGERPWLKGPEAAP